MLVYFNLIFLFLWAWAIFIYSTVYSMCTIFHWECCMSGTLATDNFLYCINTIFKNVWTRQHSSASHCRLTQTFEFYKKNYAFLIDIYMCCLYTVGSTTLLHDVLWRAESDLANLNISMRSKNTTVVIISLRYSCWIDLF